MYFRSYFFPILIAVLFFASSFFLSLRQEYLLGTAQENLVTAAFVDPRDINSQQFFIRQGSKNPKTLTIEYQYANQKKMPTKTETVTLNPKEVRTFNPEGTPRLILIHYQDQNNQESTLTLYKK